MLMHDLIDAVAAVRHNCRAFGAAVAQNNCSLAEYCTASDGNGYASKCTARKDECRLDMRHDQRSRFFFAVVGMLMRKEDNEERFEFFCQRFLDSGGNQCSFDFERILNKAVLASVLYADLFRKQVTIMGVTVSADEEKTYDIRLVTP